MDSCPCDNLPVSLTRPVPRPYDDAMKPVRMFFAVLALMLTVSACGGGSSEPDSSSTPSAALGAGDGKVEDAIKNTKLTPDTRYHFDDVIQGVLDVELTAPSPALFDAYDPSFAVLSPSELNEVDALWFIDPNVLRVPTDPYFSTEEIASAADFLRLSKDAPDDALGHFAGLPFVETIKAAHEVTVGDNTGRALDIKIRDLPEDATRCAYGSITKCATITMMPGIGQSVQAGQSYRVIELKLPFAQVIVIQNLDMPSIQKVLDTASFIKAT